jgi:CRP/FNR family transcriptional regulator, cyclic AMP receptor protein
MIQALGPLISEHPFFQGLDEPYVQLIAGCAKNVRFDEGKIVFRQGDPADHFYLVREGLVAVELMIPHRGSNTVLTAGSGEVVGWSWLFPPYVWHFDARALQTTRALAFDGKCLRSKCEQDHDLGYELLMRFARMITQRLETTKLQLMDLYGANS